MTTRPAPEHHLEHWDDFLRILQRVPAGQTITVNHLRDDLDAAQIPETSRGGLFSQACNTGHLTPLTVHGVGDIYQPSTGDTAHRARVRVYTRRAAA
jgi:hypothetical protein